jgi:hypothetical protein
MPVTGLVLLAVALAAADSASAETSRDEQVMAVLDQYMDALNELDLERHVATYHFPHYRHASGEIAVWQDARQAMPLLAVPEGERREKLRELLGPAWQRSQWTQRKIVQGDGTKVHVVTSFVRLRTDGSEIGTFHSLYVVTFENDRWAIKGRSSFAP